MCLIESAERIAFAEKIIAAQSLREIKAEPSPEAMERLVRLLIGAGQDFFEVLEAFISGRLVIERAQLSVAEILYDAHRTAHVLGQETAAKTAVVEGLAAGRARQMQIGETQFLRGFLAQVADRDARFWDAGLEEWRMDQVARRCEMYLPKVESSASSGWVDNHPASAQFNWILGAGDHCADCPAMAAASPYYRETLFTMPRQGDTACLFQCKCRVENVQGEAAFDPAEVDLLRAVGLAA